MKTELLLERVRAGDADSLDALFRRYRKMLVAQVGARYRGLLRRRVDAEDLVHTALVRALPKVESFEHRGEGSFRRWLTHIVLQTCAKELFRDGHAGFESADTAQLRRAEERTARELDGKEMRRIEMIESMGDLDEDEREVLILRLVEDRSFDDIGEILGCARETARERYGKAQARLSRLLGR